jgi:copper(I)-binding protein
MSIKTHLFPTALALALAAASIVSAARGAEVIAGDLAITSAWARATPPNASTAAAYVTIENRGAAGDRLVGATTDVAGRVEVHQTYEENGMAMMRPLEDASIPAQGALMMEPGANHLMLTKLTAPLKSGETFDMTLEFERAGSVTVPIEVAPLGAEGPAGGMAPM